MIRTSARPHYVDDPLVDRSAHHLELHADDVAGSGSTFGTCSCGGWTTPSWDSYAVLEAFDLHMGHVQDAAHRDATSTAPKS